MHQMGSETFVKDAERGREVRPGQRCALPVQEAHRILSCFREHPPLPEESGSVGREHKPSPQTGRSGPDGWVPMGTSFLPHFQEVSLRRKTSPAHGGQQGRVEVKCGDDDAPAPGGVYVIGWGGGASSETPRGPFSDPACLMVHSSLLLPSASPPPPDPLIRLGFTNAPPPFTLLLAFWPARAVVLVSPYRKSPGERK